MAGVLIPSKEMLQRLRAVGIVPYSGSGVGLLFLFFLLLGIDFFWQQLGFENFFQELKSCTLDVPNCWSVIPEFFERFFASILFLIALFFLSWLVNWTLQLRLLFVTKRLSILQSPSKMNRCLQILAEILLLALIIALSSYLWTLLSANFTQRLVEGADIGSKIAPVFSGIKPVLLLGLMLFYFLHYIFAWVRFILQIPLVPTSVYYGEQQVVKKVGN